jgi:hypothetical protein
MYLKTIKDMLRMQNDKVSNHVAKFSFDAMKEKLGKLFETKIPEFPKQVQLQLPKLNKIELPKLKKVDA